jgi:nicotinamide-nucleotide amidase
MMKSGAVPYLRSLSEGVIVSRFIKFFGIGEASLEQELRPAIEHAENPTVASYVMGGECYLRVTASGATEAECEALLAPVVDGIVEKYKNYVYGVDVDSLEAAVSDRLRALGKNVAVAESCTGGLIGSRFTAIPGATDVFWGGAVTYAADAKARLLGVPTELIAEHGVVSEAVALAMADGILGVSGADFALSVTGLCGPDGDERGVAAGTVYIGFAAKDGKHDARCVNVGKRRDRGRNMAAGWALKLLLENIS